MDTVKCFRYDKWLTLTPDQLQPGDQFKYRGKAVIVTGEPSLIDGKWHVPAVHPEPQPIRVDLSYGILSRCMDWTGTGLEVFPDGTAILADLDFGTGYVYSPRLPKAELEAFCNTHQGRYKAFYEANRDAIDHGENVAMSPWWNDAAAETTVAPR